jgi:ATP-dependent protease HslVU (ClpYQ) peptidase subunit
MTVIAYDGKQLAGDKMTNFGGLHGTTTKVHRIGDLLVGGAGTTAQIIEMQEWIRSGHPVDRFPTPQRDAKDCVSMLVIHRDGTVWQFENTPHPIVIENKFWAIGSGRDYAMAAMHLGCTARAAVQVAMALDSGCGNGVDVIGFDA